MKVIYYLYFIFLPIILYKKNLFHLIADKKNFFFFFISTSIFFNLITYYLNTGCFLYPVEQTCLIENKWSIPINEVKELSIHYEWWAKAGGGPEFTSELNKIDYIENFNWLSNWIERHFLQSF